VFHGSPKPTRRQRKIEDCWVLLRMKNVQNNAPSRKKVQRRVSGIEKSTQKGRSMI
jgi:hypothetical protein